MVITSGLPLLMVKGSFTSLSHMTVKNLETFIPFMVQCSVQRASAECDKNRPVWWPAAINFRFPMSPPRGLNFTKYRQLLITIVHSCYQYHKQQYILAFCEQLSSSPGSVVMHSNKDGTTSLYNNNKLHILTFNNQMLEYDQGADTPKPPSRRCLMPNRKAITDVYLCENCDEEFTTKSSITAHEQQCYGREEIEEPEDDTTPQDLLGYLQLGTEPLVCSQPSSSHRRVQLSLTRNKHVEFSSLLGRRILEGGAAKKDFVTKPEKLVQAYEAYCYVSVRGKARETYSFRNNYRRPTTREESYCRPYTFSRAQRRDRYLTLKTGLNSRSRSLLSQMKRVSITVNRCQRPRTPSPGPPPLITICDDPLNTDESSSPPSDIVKLSNDSPNQVPPLPNLYFKGKAHPVELIPSGKFKPIARSTISNMKQITEVDLCSSDDE